MCVLIVVGRDFDWIEVVGFGVGCWVGCFVVGSFGYEYIYFVG